jgi:hypothetical protein
MICLPSVLDQAAILVTSNLHFRTHALSLAVLAETFRGYICTY